MHSATSIVFKMYSSFIIFTPDDRRRLIRDTKKAHSVMGYPLRSSCKWNDIDEHSIGGISIRIDASSQSSSDAKIAKIVQPKYPDLKKEKSMCEANRKEFKSCHKWSSD